MPDQQRQPTVYLAGPDVFYPNALDIAAEKKKILAAHGMAGRFPLDTELDPAAFTDEKDFALAIARGNELLMREADLILANIEPWRGPEADDGTAYEIGFMAALGKLIVLYTNDTRPFGERIRNDVYDGRTYQDGTFERGRRDDMMVERFDGFADNLLLINAATASAESALGTRPDPARIVQIDFSDAANFARQLWDNARQRTSHSGS
jgi:nucleoside 2-deoxyribosyltransferase